MKRLHSDQYHQNQNSSSSAEAVTSSDDLLLELFGRLLLKPLVRLKSVSKRWNSLVSDPRLHLLRNKRPVGLMTPAKYMDDNDDHLAFFVPFHKSDDRPTTYLKELPISSDTNRPYSWITILHSCNGLLLCEGSKEKTRFDMRNFVLNPTTMKCTTLPESTFIKRSHVHAQGMSLAFDPFNSPHYKVICITNHRLFQVYSSETGSWKDVRLDMDVSTQYLLIRKGVYWNGAIHWISNERNFDSFYFNPDQEDLGFRVFPSPPGSVEYGYYFGESGGYLHYVDNTYKTGEVTVYEMRTDYSQWFVKFNFRVDVRCKCIRLHYLVRAEKEEDSFVVFWDKEGLVQRNILSEKFESMNGMTLPGSLFMFPYFESICLVY